MNNPYVILRHLDSLRISHPPPPSPPSLPMPVVLNILYTLRRKKESEEEERKGEEEKSNGCTLNFYNGYFDRKKKLLDTKDHLVVTFSKIRLDIYSCHLQYYQVTTLK